MGVALEKFHQLPLEVGVAPEKSRPLPLEVGVVLEKSRPLNTLEIANMYYLEID